MENENHKNLIKTQFPHPEKKNKTIHVSRADEANVSIIFNFHSQKLLKSTKAELMIRAHTKALNR